MEKKSSGNETMRPSIPLLCKLGSIAVHAEEMLSTDFHEFDAVALKALLDDADVKQWIKGMDKLALIPKKRKK